MFFSRKVEVTFVRGTGEIIGTAKIDADKLPESFLHETTINLGDAEWLVRGAEPPTRAEYARTRRLVLTLEPVTTLSMDPGTILFSLPSINDALPAESGAADGSEVVLAEDDWRQLEFVHVGHAADVLAEIQDIRAVHEKHRTASGFREIHVRKRIPQPFAGAALTAESLSSLGAGPERPIRFDRYGTRIAGGFAHDLPGGSVLYGNQSAGSLETLALLARTNLPERHTAALQTFSRAHALLLVDWCACRVEGPGDASLEDIRSADS